MKSYKEYYGADSDGNRGMMITNYELEPSDDEYIIEYLKDNYPENWYEPDEYPWEGNVYVHIIDPYTEEMVEWLVNPMDYVNNGDYVEEPTAS